MYICLNSLLSYSSTYKLLFYWIITKSKLGNSKLGCIQVYDCEPIDNKTLKTNFPLKAGTPAYIDLN